MAQDRVTICQRLNPHFHIKIEEVSMVTIFQTINQLTNHLWCLMALIKVDTAEIMILWTLHPFLAMEGHNRGSSEVRMIGILQEMHLVEVEAQIIDALSNLSWLQVQIQAIQEHFLLWTLKIKVWTSLFSSKKLFTKILSLIGKA